MIRPIAVLLLLATAAPALAQSYADLEAVDRAVAAFTGLPLGSPGGAAQRVDPRLRLAPCRLALRLEWYGTLRDTVAVKCPVPGGWRLYVALAGGGHANLAAEPLIQRGDAVTIMVSGEGFAVSQPGEAMEAGAGGVWIKVHGTAPGAPVLRARVIRPGVVGMDLP